MMIADDCVITLVSKDGKEFTVLYKAVQKSKTLANVIEKTGTENKIPIYDVHSDQLQRVLEFCACENADDTFFDNIPYLSLIDIIPAANYLECSEMLQLACKALTGPLIGKTPEETFALFGMDPTELTSEKIAEIEAEEQWLKDF